MLLHHRHIADARDFNAIENKFAKAMVYVSSLLALIYLIGLSIPFAIIANEDRSIVSTELLCVLMQFILFIDFDMRFVVQQTPAQIVRPYLLLPIRRSACIDTFIFSSLVKWGNLVWLTFVLPYILMSVVFSYGMLTSLMLVLYVVMLVLANSQWYAIVRTLVNDSFVWWLLPVAVYAIEAAPLFVGDDAGLTQLYNTYSWAGTLINSHSPLPLLAALAVLAALVAANRKVQSTYVMREIMRTEKKTTVKNANRYTFLERYGELGTYLQLEVKLLTRNKNPRKAFLTGIFTVIMVSVVIITSDIYDSAGMTNWWGMYNFILLGMTILVRAMGYEGNYIDCLLVHREQIYTLLRAKYILYSLLLILPLLLMLPLVISGKWSLYMVVSYAIFTMGFQYFLLFQTAVYNKQTIPLNEKLTGKGGLDGNYIQMVIMAGILIVPNILVGILQALVSDNTAYTILAAIGLGFVATNKLWLHNIYRRMMKRKYVNLESFMATRQ